MDHKTCQLIDAVRRAYSVTYSFFTSSKSKCECKIDIFLHYYQSKVCCLHNVIKVTPFFQTMLFTRTYKLKSSGSKRLNIGLAPNSNFTCIVEIEDLHHHSAVKLRVNDAEQFDSVLESVLFKMAKPVRHHHEEEKEFNILGCASKIATLKNGRVILMIKSPESGLCVYLSESAVSKLGDLRFALYNFSSKLLHWRSLVRSYFDIVVITINGTQRLQRTITNLKRYYFTIDGTVQLTHNYRLYIYIAKFFPNFFWNREKTLLGADAATELKLVTLSLHITQAICRYLGC